jgi:hypothetical protein
MTWKFFTDDYPVSMRGHWGEADMTALRRYFRKWPEAVIHSLELTGLMSDFLKAAWTRDGPAMNKARAGCEKS